MAVPEREKIRFPCLLYTSDAADEEDSVDLGGGRNNKKKQNIEKRKSKKKKIKNNVNQNAKL